MKSRVGEWNNRSFILEYDYDCKDFQSETRILWLNLIKNAQYDYINYKFSSKADERGLHFNAKSFLFDDDFTFELNGKRIKTSEICDAVGIDIDGLRYTTKLKEEELNRDREIQKGTQYSIFDI
jgi:hypothetical protein